MARSRSTWTKENPPPTVWKPGQSGNPRGSVPTSLLEPARQLTKEALGVIAGLMRNSKDEQIRLNAAAEILNRGWGKPRQAVALDVAGELTVRGGIAVPPRAETWEEWQARWRADIEALEGPARPNRRLLNS